MTDHVGKALIDEDCIKDIHKCFVHKECFKKKRNKGSTLSQDQKGGIQPGSRSVEYGEEGCLGKKRPYEEVRVDEGGQEQDRNEAGLEERVEVRMGEEVDDALEIWSVPCLPAVRNRVIP